MACLTGFVQAQAGGGIESARQPVLKLIAQSGAETVAVAACDLRTGQTLLIDERVSLHAASTMKVPVMMELFRLAELNKLDLDGSIKIRNSFSSIVDGSPYQLSATIGAGSLTVITGANGAGKSTTLAAIMGLIRPDEVTACALWLCAPGSEGVNGQALRIDGGEA